jgi:hypothetical protein
MKIISNSILTLTFILFFNISFSQQKTVYEKRVNTITLNFINELGLKNLANKYNSTGDLGSIMAMSEMSSRLNTERGLIALLRFKEELKKAEKLKNADEIKKDKIKKETEEANLKAIELKKEKAEEERLKKIAFENSDDYNLRSEIKQEFTKWIQKSEFEKNETFLNRIQNNSQKSFDSICYNIIIDRIEDKGKIKPILNFEKYNSEEEYFNLTIEIENTKFNDLVKVPINEAQDVKSYSYIQTIRAEENDWCLIDNEIYPTTISLKQDNKEIKQIILKNQNQIPLNYSTKDLEITSESLSGKNLEFSFLNYKNYLKEEKRLLQEEKAKQDSIAKSNIIYANPEVNSLPIGVEQKDNEDYSVLNKFREDFGTKIYKEVQNDEILKNELNFCVTQTNENGNKYDDNTIMFEIKFIVEKDGSITNAKVVSNNCTQLANLVIRLLTESEKWKPGMNNNEIVRTSWGFNVSFNPTKEKKKK